MTHMEQSLIQEVFQASGGQIVGRIRLQKIFYLLEQLGLKSGLGFSYYHYGPYSEDLSTSLVMAELIDGVISHDEANTQFGATYSIYKLKKAPELPLLKVGEIPFDDAQRYLKSLMQPTSVVIELAATIHWLINEEKVGDWKAEIKNRKPGKATDPNIETALKLLKDIGLD
jgi:uncharacterized protein